MFRVQNIVLLLVILGSLGLPRAVECNIAGSTAKIENSAINCRKHSAFLTDFDGVGDGKTSNTKAFKAAIRNLNQYAADGGAQLIVPPGRWLRGSFNLRSHFTLFLHQDAVILASQDESKWPEVALLPS